MTDFEKDRLIPFPQEDNMRITIACVSGLWLVAILIMLRQIITAGYFSCLTDDTLAFTSWAAEFTDSLKNGTLYPRWTSQSFWGYGSPTFILYPPLAFYFASFFSMFGVSVIAGMNIAKVVALSLAGTGIFFLVKDFYPKKTAFLSASLFLCFPYNAFGLYYFWTFASTVAIIWFSPIILNIYRFYRYGTKMNILYAGLCYGGLIATHPISAYMFFFLIAGLFVFMSLSRRDLWICAALPILLIISILSSAAYILPLLYERNLLNLGAFITGYFDFRHHFFHLGFSGKQTAGSFGSIYYPDFFFNIIILIFLTFIFSIDVLRIQKEKEIKYTKFISAYFLLSIIIIIFLLFRLSGFIWETIPFFKFIQFPARWLPISYFLLAFLSAALIQKIERNYPQKRKQIVDLTTISLIFLICIVLTFRYIRLATEFTEREVIPAKQVNWADEHLPSNIDLKIIDKDFDEQKKIILQKGTGNWTILLWNPDKRILAITALSSVSLRVRTFYFPGWKAYIDGNPSHLDVESTSGAMLVDVPPGRHMLELKFVDTPIRHYSKLITMLTLTAAAVITACSSHITKAMPAVVSNPDNSA